MATSEGAETPAAKPLDAERARLRTAGLTDEEIGRIFVARELGAQVQQAGVGSVAGAPGQAPMSGVMSNLTAVLAYVRGFIPAIASQILTVRDRSATASARLTAFLALVVKAGLIFVLGYAIFQEWNQHIISATQVASSQAVKETAAADYAAATRKAEAERAEADAERARNEASASQLARQRAESEAAKAKADACTARVESLAKNKSLNQILGGTPSAEDIQLAKDCGGPTNAATGSPMVTGISHSNDDSQNPVDIYKSIMSRAKNEPAAFSSNAVLPSMTASCVMGMRVTTQMNLGDNHVDSPVRDLLPWCEDGIFAYLLKVGTNHDFGSPHNLTEAADTQIKRAFVSIDIASDIKQCVGQDGSYRRLLACSCMAGGKLGLHSIADTVYISTTLPDKGIKACNNMSGAFAESDGPNAEADYKKLVDETRSVTSKRADTPYENSVRIAKQAAINWEAKEIQTNGSPGVNTASALAELAGYLLYVRDFTQSLDAADRAFKLDPISLEVQESRAFALMFCGRTAEAKAIFLAHRGEKLSPNDWNTQILIKLRLLRNSGITHPMMAEIEVALK